MPCHAAFLSNLSRAVPLHMPIIMLSHAHPRPRPRQAHAHAHARDTIPVRMPTNAGTYSSRCPRPILPSDASRIPEYIPDNEPTFLHQHLTRNSTKDQNLKTKISKHVINRDLFCDVCFDSHFFVLHLYFANKCTNTKIQFTILDN